MVATDGAAGPGKRERNKADKQGRILDAATQLFREKGFDETTTAEIARLAGIGAGTLYLYVGSKEDLLVSVFRESAGAAWDTAFAETHTDQPLLGQLARLFGRVTEQHETELPLARAFFRQLQFVGDPARAGVAEFMRAIYGRLIELLEQAQSEGRLDPEVPAASLTANLFAIWYLRMQRHTGGLLDLDYTLERLTRDFGTALWGLTPER